MFTLFSKVIIKIIDINDNQPQFPRSRPITISEGKISSEEAAEREGYCRAGTNGNGLEQLEQNCLDRGKSN